SIVQFLDQGPPHCSLGPDHKDNVKRSRNRLSKSYPWQHLVAPCRSWSGYYQSCFARYFCRPPPLRKVFVFPCTVWTSGYRPIVMGTLPDPGAAHAPEVAIRCPNYPHSSQSNWSGLFLIEEILVQ